MSRPGRQRLGCQRKEPPVVPGSDPTLTAQQEDAIVALLNEPTLARAAKAAGVGERSLQKWMKEPGFLARYRELRRQAFEQAVAMSQRYSVLAVQTLAQVMASPSAAPQSKVAAAVAMLRFGRDGIEIEDLEQRIEALEAQAVPEVSFESPGVHNATTRELGLMLDGASAEGLGTAAEPAANPGNARGVEP